MSELHRVSILVTVACKITLKDNSILHKTISVADKQVAYSKAVQYVAAFVPFYNENA